ncbi:glycosyltransferase family 4 protein [Kitasatospora aureofaciens]|uniref:glycosyltransferase family 4 protein n=1 Tax=Kitasatospora aureofaciens TaxID=1894 RepID=UPI001C47EBC1|nr:glycosyltransferase family 4 protein [Kitasatospora aureofaciens]MBV6699963.1 glycosyltransferase family 4 protein [Kitasatospora aureofaciens]
MRIAYLHGGSIPSFFANGVHVMRMCDAFSAAGHDVTLYSMPGSCSAADPYAYYGVRHRFPIRLVPSPDDTPAGYWKRAAHVRELLIRDTVPDLVYGRDPYGLSAAADLAPFVYEVHQLRKDLSPPQTERELLGRPRLARVVTITHALAGDLQQAHAALGPLPILVAPDCADPVDPATTSTAPTLPGRPDVPRIGYVGHLYAGRGIDLILDLGGRLPGLDFHLVGGTAEDRAHWEGRCSLPNVFFHGHQPPASLPAYYPLLDVVLAPYQRKVYTWAKLDETGRWASPMKLFEYMAHGRPIISSDLPVLREVLQDRVNCLLCPPDDPQAWADALTELVTDEPLRRALGAEAERQLLDRYTWRRRADVVLAGLGLPGATGSS